MPHVKKCAFWAITVAAAAGIVTPVAAQTSQPVRRLSIDDAVKLALEQNLGIEIERLNPQIEDVTVAQARSYWVPTLVSTLQTNSQSTPSTSVLSGGQTAITNSALTTQFGVNQVLPTGTSYSAAWNNGRTSTNNIFTNYEPQLSSYVAFNVTQPLLKNRTIDTYRQQLLATRKDREASDISLNATIALTRRNVKNAYWDLAYARDNLTAQQQSLDLAKRALADNEKRVQIGTMAPIDIVEAQSEVARNEETVIVAQAAIEEAEDRLRVLIFNPSMADFWNTSIEPTESMPFQPAAVDLDGAIRRAVASRTDVQLAKNSLEHSELNLKYYRSQVLPQVDAQLSYQSNGIGGTQLTPLTSLTLATTNRAVLSQRGFGSVLGDVFTNAYPTWALGVTVSYPIGNSTQETTLARAQLQLQQAQAQLRNTEMQIASQVRDAARQVQTNAKRVDSARAARDLAEQKLAAEEKKFTAGIEINFFVFQAQRDLAQARTAEIKAIADYNKSVVDLEAVQETSLTGTAPLTTAGSGGIITAVTSTGSSLSTTSSTATGR
jgi:outer membrane protein TolC